MLSERFKSFFESPELHNATETNPNQEIEGQCLFRIIVNLEDEVKRLKLQLAESLGREDWNEFRYQKLKSEFDEFRNSERLMMKQINEIRAKMECEGQESINGHPNDAKRGMPFCSLDEYDCARNATECSVSPASMKTRSLSEKAILRPSMKKLDRRFSAPGNRKAYESGDTCDYDCIDNSSGFDEVNGNKRDIEFHENASGFDDIGWIKKEYDLGSIAKENEIWVPSQKKNFARRCFSLSHLKKLDVKDSID